jgi:phosphoglycolate phosphatase
MEGLKNKAFFFDWDGTLVDTIPGVLEAHNHVRAHHGLELWTLDWFKVNMRQSARQLYPQIYGEKSQPAIDMLYDYIEKNHLHKLTPLPGAAELLETLSEREIPMAVISNKRHKYLLREIEHMGWNRHFVSAVGAGVAAKDKPDPDPILHALKETGLQANKVIYVGDTETDLQAADGAKCPTVLILNGEDKSALAVKYKPFMVTNDCGTLNAALNQTLLKKAI